MRRVYLGQRMGRRNPPVDEGRVGKAHARGISTWYVALGDAVICLLPRGRVAESIFCRTLPNGVKPRYTVSKIVTFCNL